MEYMIEASIYSYQNIYCDLIKSFHNDARQIQKNEILYRINDPFFLASQCHEKENSFKVKKNLSDATPNEICFPGLDPSIDKPA